ncbi:MAG: hypothetical protein ABI120_12925, partial [Gemmatimonadaceae bacterium]
TVATMNGSGSAGVQHVTWNFQQAAVRNAERPELTPSQKRDSVLLHVRAPAVLDSLTKAGFDSASIRTVRAQVAALINPPAQAGFGGRGGGGGGRGGAGQNCSHPTTQWETFCGRPAETPSGGGRGAGGAAAGAPAAGAAGGRGAAAAGRGGAAGGRGGAAATTTAGLSPIEHVWSLIGMNPPATGGRGGFGGGGGFSGGASLATTGDYLVQATLNGKTYKETLRVERISGDDGRGSVSGDDDLHDQSGRFKGQDIKGKKHE